MKRFIVLAILCVLVAPSCATTPPPKMENNEYQNYRYGFVLKLPGGAWKPTKKMPSWFRQGFVAQGRSTSKVKLMLFNNETQGVMLVLCEKSRFSIRSFRNARKKLEEAFEKERKKLLKMDMIKSCTYDVRSDYPGCRWTLKVDAENEMQKLKIITRGFMYPLDDDTCFTNLMLGSNLLSYDQNLETFNQMYDSFKHGWLYSFPLY